MIRITFITGAGKLARQKYDENAAKTVSSTLRELGYIEDRGASCVNECAGMFKSQHDTGKNLKTIVVFPKILSDGSNSNDDGINQKMSNMSIGGKSIQSLLEAGSPKEMIAMSASMNTFERMILNKCPSWSQKKVCQGVIADLKDMLESLDNKLLHGSLLTDAEQEFYDGVSIDALGQKAQFVRDEMKKHVDEGKITKVEKEKLINQVKEKIESLSVEIDQATKDKKPKKLENLTNQKGKLLERYQSLDKILPDAPVPLKHQTEISNLRKEMQPMLKLEKEAKGRLLSIKETAMMTRKEEIEEEILDLEEKSRGWFEDDDDFQLRVAASRAKKIVVKKTIVKTSGSSSANGGAKKPITNWIVPGASAKKQANIKKTKTKTASSNAFAAMMMDSDSDSD